MSSVSPNILLLQLEFSTWATARPWTYSANFAVREGLEAAGVQCITIPVIAEISCTSPNSWMYHARQLLAGRTFDQVWVWLVHAPLDPNTLEWITNLAPVRVGIVMESLRYTPDDYVWAPHLRQRQALVESQVHFMTHVLTFDERDAEDLSERGLAKTLWWPAMVPERVIVTPSTQPLHRSAVFQGTPYGPRERWVNDPVLRDLLTYQKAGPPTQYHRFFDELQQRGAARLRQGNVDETAMHQYVRTLHKVRLGEFQEWMASLSQWPTIINLPSLAKFYGGRVFEGMAAGRPVISSRIKDHPRNLALFEDEKELLLFPSDDPDALARQIRRVQEDPSLAHRLAANARKKLRRYHTAEQRLKDTLAWIETGIEPSYGLTALSSATRPEMPVSQADHKITVFVLTVDDPAFAACLEALHKQEGPPFTLDIIRNVYPFSAAAQAMIDRCRSPYFIQADEDMVLVPDAVASMGAVMAAAPDDVGMICFHLFDEDRGIPIQGVKIYRTALMKSLTFQDVKASEMDLLEQMGRHGIQWILHPDIKGRHGTVYTPDTIYRRYKTMYEKDIRQWNVLTSDIRQKADAFRRSGDPLQLFALLGNGDLSGHCGAIVENLFQHVRHDDFGRFRGRRNSLFQVVEDSLNRFLSLCIDHGGGVIVRFRCRRAFGLLLRRSWDVRVGRVLARHVLRIRGRGRWEIGPLTGIDGHHLDPMLLHELDGLLIFDQTLMGEKWSSVPRDIHLYDEHAGSELFDRDTFCRHKSLDSGSEGASIGLADRIEIHGVIGEACAELDHCL